MSNSGTAPRNVQNRVRVKIVNAIPKNTTECLWQGQVSVSQQRYCEIGHRPTEVHWLCDTHPLFAAGLASMQGSRGSWEFSLQLTESFRSISQMLFRVNDFLDVTVGEQEKIEPSKKNPHAQALSALGVSRGGMARAKTLSAKRRKAIAKKVRKDSMG